MSSRRVRLPKALMTGTTDWRKESREIALVAPGVSWIRHFGSPDGTPDGCPVYSTDVPFAVIPLTGQPDTLSLSFNGAQSILFDSFFLLHRTFGDATLEYFIKVTPGLPRASIFWTRPTTLPDENRFNLFVIPGGTLSGATIGSRTAQFTDLWAAALKWRTSGTISHS